MKTKMIISILATIAISPSAGADDTSHNYATPMSGYENYVENNEWVDFKKENQNGLEGHQNKEESEKSRSVGMKIFRAFQGRIESSAKEFQDRAGGAWSNDEN